MPKTVQSKTGVKSQFKSAADVLKEKRQKQREKAKERERKRQLKQQDYNEVHEGTKPLTADGKRKDDIMINKEGRYGLKSRRNHPWPLAVQKAWEIIKSCDLDILSMERYGTGWEIAMGFNAELKKVGQAANEGK